jgi:hypothetical protein
VSLLTNCWDRCTEGCGGGAADRRGHVAVENGRRSCTTSGSTWRNHRRTARCQGRDVSPNMFRTQVGYGCAGLQMGAEAGGEAGAALGRAARGHLGEMEGRAVGAKSGAMAGAKAASWAAAKVASTTAVAGVQERPGSTSSSLKAGSVDLTPSRSPQNPPP